MFSVVHLKVNDYKQNMIFDSSGQNDSWNIKILISVTGVKGEAPQESTTVGVKVEYMAPKGPTKLPR